MSDGDTIKVNVASSAGVVEKLTAIPCEAGLCVAQSPRSGKWGVIHFRSGSAIVQLIPTKELALEIAADAAERWKDWNEYPSEDVFLAFELKWAEFFNLIRNDRDRSMDGFTHVRNDDEGEIL